MNGNIFRCEQCGAQGEAELYDDEKSRTPFTYSAYDGAVICDACTRSGGPTVNYDVTLLPVRPVRADG